MLSRLKGFFNGCNRTKKIGLGKSIFLLRGFKLLNWNTNSPVKTNNFIPGFYKSVRVEIG